MGFRADRSQLYSQSRLAMFRGKQIVRNFRRALEYSYWLCRGLLAILVAYAIGRPSVPVAERVAEHIALFGDSWLSDAGLNKHGKIINKEKWESFQMKEQTTANAQGNWTATDDIPTS